MITDDKVSRRAVLIIFVNFGSDQYQLETKIFDYDEFNVRDENSLAPETQMYKKTLQAPTVKFTLFETFSLLA